MIEATSSGAVPQPIAVTESKAHSLVYSGGCLQRVSFDREYVEHLIAGDAEVERHFADYFGELLVIKLRSRLRDPQLIQDLRQETFVRVLTALRTKNSLQSPESLGAFVNSVCNNLLFEIYRRDARHRAIGIDEEFDPPDNRASIESDIVSKEQCEEVRKVLDELPPKDRDLLRMFFLDGIDRDTICRLFRVEREYLRVLMHRAKGRFRERLLKRYAEAGRAQS